MSKLAFLGVAHIHTPAFVGQCIERGIPVAGVWDPSPEKAAATAARLSCPVRSVEDILADPEVTAVVVCSETNLHQELVAKICAAKKAAFVEKPLGMAKEDAEAMGAMMKEAGIVFHTGYMSRGDKRYRTARKWMREGKMGLVTRLRSSYCHCGALQGWFDNEWRWMADSVASGVGAFGDLGTHGLDLLMWFGGDVEQAAGYIGKGTARYPDCDEYGEAVILFKSGVVATLAGSWDDWTDPVRFLMAGTEGYAWIVQEKLWAKFGEGEAYEVPESEMEPDEPAGFTAFVNWFLGQPAELVSVDDAISRCVVMDQIYKFHPMV